MSKLANTFTDWVETQSQSDTGFALSPELRETSISTIRKQGFPTRKDEEWRYTSVKKIAGTTPSLLENDQVSIESVSPYTEALPDAHLLVFVNGKYSTALSADMSVLESQGLSIRRIEELDHTALQRAEETIVRSKLTDDNIFRHITNSLATSGLFIEGKQNAEIELPLHLLFMTSSRASTSFTNPLNIIHLSDNARLKIVEQFVSTDTLESITLPATYIHQDAGSNLELYRIGLESEKTDHISNTSVDLAKTARFEAHQYLLGSRLTRSNMELSFAGTGGEVCLRGIYLGNRSQHLDIRTYIDHAHPHCTSDQHFRGILKDESRGVFNGMVMVREQAQKTDAQQSNKNLLLSRNARVDTKPQLEIYADDVKCTHGATIGELDENALFYLQSRGISKDDAAQMLTRAFSAEITDEIKFPSLKAYIQKEIESRLMESR